MRKPEDSRSMDVCILSLALVAYVRAIKAPTLVLITVMLRPFNKVMNSYIDVLGCNNGITFEIFNILP
jgi:hypothetical protein